MTRQEKPVLQDLAQGKRAEIYTMPSVPQGTREIAQVNVSEDEKKGLELVEMLLEEGYEKKKHEIVRAAKSREGITDIDPDENGGIDLLQLNRWDRILLKSREKRISNEKQNEKDKDDLRLKWVGGKAIAEVQDILAGTGRGFLGKLALRWGVRGLGIEGASALATVYGIGDLTSLISGIVGRDILTGERLDSVDRVIFLVAAATPYVSAIYLVDPIRYGRKKLEDSTYHRLMGDKEAALKDSQEAYAAGKEIMKLSKGSLGKLKETRKMSKQTKVENKVPGNLS